MRIYDNPHNLRKITIDRRLQKLDIEAESFPYTTAVEDGKIVTYLVGVDSTLSDEAIDNLLRPAADESEATAKSLLAEVDDLKAQITTINTKLAIK